MASQQLRLYWIFSFPGILSAEFEFQVCHHTGVIF